MDVSLPSTPSTDIEIEDLPDLSTDPSAQPKPICKWNLRLTSVWDLPSKIRGIEDKILDRKLPMTEELRGTLLNIINALATTDFDACVEALKNIEDSLYVIEKKRSMSEGDVASLLDFAQSKWSYIESVQKRLDDINRTLQPIPEDSEVMSWSTPLDEELNNANGHLAQDEFYLNQEHLVVLNDRIILVALDDSINEMSAFRENLLKVQKKNDEMLEIMKKQMEKLQIVRAFIAKKTLFK